jgi:hypothetical protein
MNQAKPPKQYDTTYFKERTMILTNNNATAPQASPKNAVSRSRLGRFLNTSAVVGLSALVLGVCGVNSANALPVLNGGFESTTNGPNFFIGPGEGTAPSDWSFAGGIAAIYGPNAADTTGAVQSGGRLVYLWGPANGAANGLGPSPSGGNYFASDSDPSLAGALSQTITGLTPGEQYILTFDFGAAQFRNADGSLWNGATNSAWRVTLGTETFDTASLAIGSHGFSGWQTQSFTYTATAATEVLSFLAFGGPGGLPPVALLDGVSLVPVTGPSPVSEPATYLLMTLSIVGFVVAARRKQYRA